MSQSQIKRTELKLRNRVSLEVFAVVEPDVSNILSESEVNLEHEVH